MVSWWTAKGKNFWTYFSILKVALYTFFQKQKLNLDFQRIFDNPLAKYLISNEFQERINYISSYLPKSEQTQ